MHDRIMPFAAWFIGGLSLGGNIRNQALRLYAAARKAANQLQRILHRLPNGHLHIGLLGALIASSLIAIAIPISRSQASETSIAPDVRGGSMMRSHIAVLDAAVTPAPSPASALRTTSVPYTLHEDGLSSSHQTMQVTVGAALEDLGIHLHDADIVTPARDAELAPGTHVYVHYARRIRLVIGADTSDVYTQAATVGEALAGAGYDVQPSDTLFPTAATPVRNGMLVGLTMVREVDQQEDASVPFNTVYQYDSQMAYGKQVVVQPGTVGTVRREYRVRLVNGLEASRQLLSETNAPATTQVVSVGTYVAPPPPTPVVSGPDGSQCAKTITVWSTFYTAASAGGSTTRTGTGVYKGIVAVDPRVIPLGTQLYIPGYGYGLAADTGGGVKGAWIDLAYGPSDVYDWYSHYVDICILG